MSDREVVHYAAADVWARYYDDQRVKSKHAGRCSKKWGESESGFFFGTSGGEYKLQSGEFWPARDDDPGEYLNNIYWKSSLEFTKQLYKSEQLMLDVPEILMRLKG